MSALRLWIPLAVFGLLLGYGMMYPNQQIYLYFLLPIKAKYFVAIYGLFELFNGIASSGSSCRCSTRNSLASR